MRILASEDQQQRKEKILQAVVHLFIKTGKPVGSSTILESFRLGLSPASVRNVLADLEKEGFLTHPHTSAGRVPTDKGYRTYVNSIANIQRLASEEERRIKSEYARRMKEIDDLMMSTTRVLSTLSHCTGFMLPPKLHEETLRRIELIPVDRNHILAVLVSDAGLVQNQTIVVDQMPNDESLREASRILGERLAGLSFNEAHNRLIHELNLYRDRQESQREFLQVLSRHLFDGADRTELIVEGTSNLFNFPEFQDYETMRTFAQLVDEKESLGQVLTREFNNKGLQVKIGSEAAPELRNFSVVSTSYNVRGRPVGVLGILGPKRMQYDRMMAIVDTVANLVNRVLDGREDIFSSNLLENKKIVTDNTIDERPELADKLAQLEILRQSLEASKAKEKDLFDQLIRLTAEFDNFRKRAETRVQDARRAGREDILLQLISLSDALVQAETAMKNATDVKAVKTGLTLVHQQFEKFLRDQGLVPIKAVGEKLDPHRHEAVAQEVREDKDDGHILDEIQRGYMWQDRLVRPSRVRVAVKPQTKEKQEEKNHG